MTNPTNYAITSRFSVDRSYTVNGVYYQDKHDGVDFAYPQGTPVTLPPDGSWDGTVIVSQLDQHGGGWVDVRADSDGGVARFLHFSRIDVKVGQKVKSNDVLGLSGGATGTWGAGLSNGPHLHIGLFVGGKPTDPLPWLEKSYSTASQPTPSPQPPADNRFYTVQQGGWRSQVIQEIINAGIWQGTWQENEPKFLELNGLPPQGGYRAGMQVRIAPDPQVDSIKVSEPAPIQPQPEVQPAQPTILSDHVPFLVSGTLIDAPTISVEKPIIFTDPVQPQPEVQPAQPTMPTISVEKPIIFTDPVQPQLTAPKEEPETEVVEVVEKPVEIQKPETFSFNKLIIGIVSGKNFLANSTFFLGLAGVYAFYNQNQEEINLALGLASQAVSMIFVLVRKYQEQG